MRNWVWLLVGLVGCSQPRIDASSPESCSASMDRVIASMSSGEDSAAFMGFVLGVTGSAVFGSLGDAFNFGFNDAAPSVRAPSSDSTQINRAICRTMDGLTASQIVAGADSLPRVAAAHLEEELARVHLDSLKAASRRYEMARDSLDLFRVESAELRQRRGFVGLEATIALRVRNDTNHPISRVHFSGRASTPGRAVPWAEGDFNYQIPGGLEPGESASWSLRPNMFGPWSDVAVPEDAEFSVEVVRLEGADGEALWGGASFTRGDVELMDSLSARFTGS